MKQMKKEKQEKSKYAEYSGPGGWKTKAEGNNGRPAVDDIVRFKKRVVKQDNGCEVWNGPVNAHERGLMQFQGRMMDVRHIAWIVAHRESPVGPVKRTCNTFKCVKASHLCITRSWNRRSERAFSDEDVRMIRKRYADGENTASISKDYPDASDHSVYCAGTHRTYKHVEDEQ